VARPIYELNQDIDDEDGGYLGIEINLAGEEANDYEEQEESSRSITSSSSSSWTTMNES
jgi:hypothetical protein